MKKKVPPPVPPDTGVAPDTGGGPAAVDPGSSRRADVERIRTRVAALEHPGS